MSGFESAIRNAIARAPDGRPQTRQRIYDAARTSLERNLARVEVADADARRRTLETTIERIEEEWRAITMRRPDPPLVATPPPAVPPASGSPAEATPPVAPDTLAQADAPAAAPSVQGVNEPSVLRVGPLDVAGGSDADALPGASVAESEALDTEGDAVATSGGAAAPSDHAPLDPALAEQLAARDAGSVVAPPVVAPDRASNVVPSAMTRGAGEGGPDRVAAVSNAAEANDAVPNAAAGDGSPTGTAPDVMPEIGPAVDAAPSDTPVPASRTKRRGGKREKPARRGRKERAAAKTAKPAQGSRGRWASRALSLAIVVGVAVLGWRWLDQSGLLEPAEADRVAVTVPRGNVPAIERADANTGAWTELTTGELSGAVEPVAGAEALRVTGPAEVALDAAALAALGPEISLSILVRAVGETGEAAVSCDFTGGGCGRLRFPVPREAEQRVVSATIADDERARLVLDPTIGGDVVAFDLLGVTARAR